MPRGIKLGGGFGLLALVAVLLLGGDPTQILNMLAGGGSMGPQTQTHRAPSADAPGDEGAQFVSVVLADTEDTWSALFKSAGARYQAPTLVLYTDYVQSACGFSSAATGPFYCPSDQKVYIDLGFFRQLQQFGASGDFAQAYVISHEIAHHVQNLLGTSRQVRQVQARVSQSQANALSVLTELQADCYAGVWAHHAHKQRRILEPGDAAEGLRAAASVGDDRMQQMAGRRIQPESFTHGSSEQRMHWFRTGLTTGRVDACDTFAQASR
jgi:predicted metalloprotease